MTGWYIDLVFWYFPVADIQSKGDVGGQKTLRTYWKNYFEKTDTLIWVVDSTDRERVHDCKTELAGLLLEEASSMSERISRRDGLTPVAFDGRQLACVQEQERRGRLHD